MLGEVTLELNSVHIINYLSCQEKSNLKKNEDGGDMPFWAYLLEQAGITPQAIPTREVTVDLLVGRLNIVLSSSQMKENAKKNK